MKKYYCNHCKNEFESEPKEGLECPLCFWSSSVEEQSEKIPVSNKVASLSESAAPSAKTPLNWAPIFSALFFVVITLSVLILAGYFAFKFRNTLQAKGISISMKSEDLKQTQKGESQDAKESEQPAISAEEEMLLVRKLQVSENRPLSDEEKKILDQRASYSIGHRESLPSKVWTEADFKSLLENQQKTYGVPISWSYSKKIQNIFKEKYLSGEAAFQQGELLKARNFWVETLALPIYGNNIQRHRGVILTMLRPFINDTLSKIGSINSGLADARLQEKEAQVNTQYQTLIGALNQSDWNACVESIQTLDRLLDELENPKLVTGETPPYPVAFAQVDDGIKATLMELAQVPPPPVASFNSLRVDLQRKLSVAQSFQPQKLEEMQAHYENGLQAVERKDFDQAVKEWEKVDFPLALYQDVQEKLKIIRKLRNPKSAVTAGETAIPIKVKTS